MHDASTPVRSLVAAVLLSVSTVATAELPDVYRAIDTGDCKAAGDAINRGLEGNDPEAWFFAGFLYDATGCVADDPARAARYYQRAVDGGYTDAANLLGRLHALGRGVPQDYATAELWYAKGRKASSTGASRSADEVRAAGYATTVAQLARLTVRYPQDAERSGVDSTLETLFDPSTAKLTYRYVRTGITTGTNVARSSAFTDAVDAAYATALARAPRPDRPVPATPYATTWRFAMRQNGQSGPLLGQGDVSIGDTEAVRQP